MKILITGAGGNLAQGLIPRLRAQGHELVLHDVRRLSDELIQDSTFVQGDGQQGIGLDRAVQGCDLVLHMPAWHGIHWRSNTEVDFWRLNVDGTFWMFQAAANANIKRVVFMSSMAWHGHYDKYGFTKRIGEEMCEYYRRNHGIGYVAVRPSSVTPWDEFPEYGTRFLYGGVHREDVMDCIQRAAEYLAPDFADEAPGFTVNAMAANAYSAEQIENWESDPLAHAETIFPDSRALIEKYQMKIERRPHLYDLGEGAPRIGYTPTRHFGTFLEELRELDENGGAAAVNAVRCHY